MQEALVVRRETHIPAPQAVVFAFLTDPEKILRWMGTEAQVEPKPGGLYLVNVTGARFARGAFREVVPVHRLAYLQGRTMGDQVRGSGRRRGASRGGRASSRAANSRSRSTKLGIPIA